MEKGIFEKAKEFFGKLSAEEAQKKILEHPVSKATYEKYSDDPEKQNKYIEFIRNHPTAIKETVVWDEKKGDFTFGGKYRMKE